MLSSRVEEKLASLRMMTSPYFLELDGIKIKVNRNVYPTSELSTLMVEA